MNEIFRNLLLSYYISKDINNFIELLGIYKAINTFQDIVYNRSLLNNKRPVDFSEE